MTPLAAQLGTITKPLLAETVHDRILSSIISGLLPPGSRLNIDDLATSFGVSRTPVREAIARLAHARLVEISRNASTTVALWGWRDMRDRVHLLGGIARVAVLNGSRSAGSTFRTLDPEPGAFVRACAMVVDRLDSRLVDCMVDELVAPLELFLTRDVLVQHGITVHAERIGPTLEFLAQSVQRGDLDEVAAAVEDLTITFARELSPAGAAPTGSPVLP